MKIGKALDVARKAWDVARKAWDMERKVSANMAQPYFFFFFFFFLSGIHTLQFDILAVWSICASP